MLNHAACLPVFTIGDPDRVHRDRVYARRIADKLLDYLFDLERYRAPDACSFPEAVMRQSLVLPACLLIGALSGAEPGSRSCFQSPLQEPPRRDRGRKGHDRPRGADRPADRGRRGPGSGKIIEETPWPKDSRLPEAGDTRFTCPIGGGSRRKADRHSAARPTFGRFATALLTFTVRGTSAPKSHIPATQVPQGWVFMNGSRLRLKCDSIPEHMGSPLADGGPRSTGRAFADPADRLQVPPDEPSWPAGAAVPRRGFHRLDGY